MKDNKRNWIIGIFIALVVIACIYLYYINYSKKDNNKTNYEADKTSTSTNNSNDVEESKKTEYVEETITTFSTKIYNNDSARQNNINITCDTLNNTIVKNGDTFSFCNTVGPSTSEKGYQKADIFDKNGNMKKGLGGGNCQVSTTLYNAVISVPTLSVIERHTHSSYVPYIEKDKDAAVAYGSYDLKFINNSGNDLVIHCSSNGDLVEVSLCSKKPI